MALRVRRALVRPDVRLSLLLLLPWWLNAQASSRVKWEALVSIAGVAVHASAREAALGVHAAGVLTVARVVTALALIEV